MIQTMPFRHAPRIAALALIGFGAPAKAAVFCVNSAGTLQTALTTAATNRADDEIRIVQGNYVGNFVYATTQANKLSVLGGYTAGCASRTLNPANTVLDGNQVNTVLALSAPGIAAKFLIEGLTLQNGKRTSGTQNGGGLYAVTGAKGDMFYAVTGTVTVRRNWIKKNTSGNDGGGAYISAGISIMANNNISENTVSRQGGGALAVAGDNTNILNNSIFNNTGIGASLNAQPPIFIDSNTIEKNSDGGVYIGFYGSNEDAPGAIISKNKIRENSKHNGQGAGLEISGMGFITVTLTNNIIQKNTLLSGSGGGFFVKLFNTGSIILTNNTITENVALFGGGIFLNLGNNEAKTSAKLYNNLFWENMSTANQGADLSIENDGGSEFSPTPVPVSLFANNFDRSAAGFQITMPVTIHSSNRNGLAPLFVDAAKGDLHLLPGSPMINAGYAQTPNLPETDFEGDPRVLGGRVDIGADEFDDGSDDAPDFRVTKLALTPGSPKVKGTFSVAVTVRNQGTASGDAGYLDVWTNQPTAVTCGADGNAWAGIGRLEPGKSRTLTLTGLRGGAAGRKTLRAVVDSWCETREVNDANNQTVKAYSVVP